MATKKLYPPVCRQCGLEHTHNASGICRKCLDQPWRRPLVPNYRSSIVRTPKRKENENGKA